MLAELDTEALKRTGVQPRQKAFDNEASAQVEPGNSLNDFRLEVLLA